MLKDNKKKNENEGNNLIVAKCYGNQEEAYGRMVIDDLVQKAYEKGRKDERKSIYEYEA